MNISNKLKNKINEIETKKGSASLEVAILTGLFLPIILILLLSSFNFYSLSSYNNDLNFQTGRFVSTTGCSVEKLSSVNHMNLYKNLRVIVNGQELKDGSNGEVLITCGPNSTKGTEFNVQTKVNNIPEKTFNFFPVATVRSGVYVQEVK